MKRVRLDSLLSERGMFPSRSRAAASVLAGEVMLLPERRRAEKPGQLVPEDVELELADAPAFVSRGGIKLANALDAFGVDVDGSPRAGRRRLHGRVHRLPAQARGRRTWSRSTSPTGSWTGRCAPIARVTVIERANARALSRDELPYAPDLIVIDVSFISVAKVLPAVLACAAERFDCLA